MVVSLMRKPSALSAKDLPAPPAGKWGCPCDSYYNAAYDQVFIPLNDQSKSEVIAYLF
jgi:hypothetical protein